MSDRRLLDTNFIVRHLVQDEPRHAAIARLLFEASDRGETELVVLTPVLAECVFVLESIYNFSRHAVASSLTTLVSSGGMRIDQPDVIKDTFVRYASTGAHFIDCLLAATAAHDDVAVATFDRDFRRFKDVRVRVD